jgi:N utilization substance protein A
VSKEIVDAVKALEAEKGIAADKLMDALEDALLSAYKKTPGAAKYARVDLDHETGDFRVFELILPPELEEKLLAEAAELQEEPEVDPETGEMREPEDPELDPEMIAPYEDQITTRDVTPEDFGRIAAQTAKQVILQRIREAERQMMYDEYQDRVGELITGIIQQSDKRYTLVQLRERVEALLPKSEQVYNERYDHGMRVKAVITDVSDSTKGPAIVVSRRSPELRTRGSRDRRQTGRDRRRRPRARLSLEDRRGLPRRRRRPGRRLRRPPRLPGADGRLRAARREDRHHSPQRRARPVRRQGAFSGPRA